MGDRLAKLRASGTALVTSVVRGREKVRDAEADGPFADRLGPPPDRAARAALEARARELGPWAQGPFALGGGLVVGREAGSERDWSALTQALPDGLAGRSVLDVGSGAGYRAWRAKLAGAAVVMAFEPGPAHEQALFLQERYELEVHLRRQGWAELHPERDGRYQLVICQDALSAERHPALLLERLRAMLAPDGVLALGALMLDDPALSGHARLDRGGEEGDEPAPAWIPGSRALRRALADSGLAVAEEIELDPGPAGPAAPRRVLLLARAAPPGAAPHREAGAPNRFPPGHYYSALPDTAELTEPARREQVWPATPRETPGIDWRDEAQLALCEVLAAQERLVFADESSGDPTEYFTANGQYPALDAWILEAMLRHLRPARMIEIGSGFSSLVSARVNREQLGGSLELTCIEPHPREFLIAGVPGITALRVEKVQDTPLHVFAALGPGDVLFFDTSHCVKTGGDVTWIFHEILPRLAPGVVVHVHDAFLPGDYPEPWVMEGWGWNERYLLQSFLAFNSAYVVELGAQRLLQRHAEALLDAFPGLARHRANGGSALWLRRV